MKKTQEQTEVILSCKGLVECDRELVSKLAEKVHIYNDRDIEVTFKWQKICGETDWSGLETRK